MSSIQIRNIYKNAIHKYRHMEDYTDIYGGQSSFVSVDDKKEIDWRVNSEEFIRKYAKTLGWRYDTEKRAWVPIQGLKQFCNEDGLRGILSIITPLSDKDIKLGYITREQFNALMKRILKTLIITLCINSEEWGVDSSDILIIYTTLRTLIHTNLSRSIEGMESKNISGNYQVQVSEVRTDKKQGLSLLGLGRERE